MLSFTINEVYRFEEHGLLAEIHNQRNLSCNDFHLDSRLFQDRLDDSAFSDIGGIGFAPTNG